MVLALEETGDVDGAGDTPMKLRVMKVTIKIEGKIETKREKIQAVLEVPDNWKPSFNEFCKVKGVVRFLTEHMSQTFNPPPEVN